MEILVSISGDATEHMEALWPYPLHQEPLFQWHGIHREVLDADEDDDRVDSRKVGDEVGEDVGDATG